MLRRGGFKSNAWFQWNEKLHSFCFTICQDANNNSIDDFSTFICRILHHAQSMCVCVCVCVCFNSSDHDVNNANGTPVHLFSAFNYLTAKNFNNLTLGTFAQLFAFNFCEMFSSFSETCIVVIVVDLSFSFPLRWTLLFVEWLQQPTIEIVQVSWAAKFSVVAHFISL